MALRAWIALILLVLMSPAAKAQDGPLRLGFRPAFNTDIVYRVLYQHDEDLAGTKGSVGWEHEVVIRLAGREPPSPLTGGFAFLTGEFTLRNVTDLNGAARDPFYLIAKAIEGETHQLKMVEHGVPVEVDWPTISERVRQRLPALTDPSTASVIASVLPGFGPEGITGVLRPFWVTSLAHLRAFARDGSVTVEQVGDVPAFYPVTGATLEAYGGRMEGSDGDALFVWRLSSDRKAAAAALGPLLTGLAGQVAAGDMRAKIQAMVDSAIADGVEAREGGVAVYDLKLGLMREIEFDARLIAGALRRETKFVITKLAPE